MPVGDPALGQVIWGHFHGNPVTIHDLNTVSPKSARHCREEDPTCVELDRKHSSFELLDHLARYFNRIFFWQFVPYSLRNGLWHVVRRRTPFPIYTLPVVAPRAAAVATVPAARPTIGLRTRFVDVQSSAIDVSAV